MDSTTGIRRYQLPAVIEASETARLAELTPRAMAANY